MFFGHRPQSYYDSDEWRGTIKLDGGAIMNQASHYVDLLYWLVGPIVEVSAFTATLGRNIEAEDTATINFKVEGWITWFNGSNNAYLSF